MNVYSTDPCGSCLKHKIGCLDALTQTGKKKKKIDQDFDRGETIRNWKFPSVVKCRSKPSHPGVVTLKAMYEDAKSFHPVMGLCSASRLLDQMWSLRCML
ncbi:hypothetical protein L2E82_44429 [Cichorium intybus]|uniref:Uncharacterized protein n=1 Tax=Cichorium intybus TaxID=13427 RepID=A0ACB8ZPU2_CICIN|nr:hypothetical protein L2E82_44429 [Cichorium intybus]